LLPLIQKKPVHPIYAGPGWIGNAWRQVSAQANADCFSIHVADVGAFLVSADGHLVEALEITGDVSNTILIEALLGPPLMLAFALRSIWTLHASAAMWGDKLVAFVGDSGNGKSTLAHFLGRELGWRRVADDILPVVASASGVVALPHFPQLKLALDRQPSCGLPARIPLHALYVISKPDETHTETVSKELAPGQAMANTLQHMVAARLFDTKLLVRQLDFAQHLAAKLPVRSLVYPRDLALLPGVAERLVCDLE
jgi:hypothetical protein